MNGTDASTSGVATRRPLRSGLHAEDHLADRHVLLRLEQPDAVDVGARLADQLVVRIDADERPGRRLAGDVERPCFDLGRLDRHVARIRNAGRGFAGRG